VEEVFGDEHARLLVLVDPLLDTDRVEPIGTDRQAFIRFDTNRYSVQTDHARLADHALSVGYSTVTGRAGVAGADVIGA
jgi:hypothetical protein